MIKPHLCSSCLLIEVIRTVVIVNGKSEPRMGLGMSFQYSLPFPCAAVEIIMIAMSANLSIIIVFGARPPTLQELKKIDNTVDSFYPAGTQRHFNVHLTFITSI